MPCTMTEEQVAELVLDVIRKVEKDKTIELTDSFEDDIGIDDEAKHTYYGPIDTRLSRGGCVLTIGPSAFDAADTVQDLVDIVNAGIERDDEDAAILLALSDPSWSAQPALETVRKEGLRRLSKMAITAKIAKTAKKTTSSKSSKSSKAASKNAAVKKTVKKAGRKGK